MTDLIYVDRENMERRMGDAVAQIDPLDQILSQLPPPATQEQPPHIFPSSSQPLQKLRMSTAVLFGFSARLPRTCCLISRRMTGLCPSN